MNSYVSHGIADRLARLDGEDLLPSSEVTATALIHSCLLEVPDLAGALFGVEVEDTYRYLPDHIKRAREQSWPPQWEGRRRDHHGHGDLIAVSRGLVVGHLEIKGRWSLINRSSTCCGRPNCQGPERTQLHHMCEDGVPVLVLGSPHARAHRILTDAQYDDVRDLLIHMCWSDLAELIRTLPPVRMDPVSELLGLT